MSLTAKLVALGVLVLALLAGAWKVYHAIDKAGYARAQAEYQAAAEFQRESNRGRARAAEEKQAVQTVYRDRFITKTVKEIRDVPSAGTGCLVAPRVVRLLNDAAACAREDRPGSCSVHESMPDAR